MLKIYLNNKPGKKIQPSMSYYKNLGLTRLIADIYESAVTECTLMSFVDLISCKYNIINKIGKADTYRYHTIQNNYIIVSYAPYACFAKSNLP